MSESIEYIDLEDRFKSHLPLSLAVKAGKLLFVSGIPAFDAFGQLAIGDFRAQMAQVMKNIAAILKKSGCGWDRVVRTRVFLTRQADFDDMNRIYAAHFPFGRFPARTTLFVHALPQPGFLVEVECEAILS